ncbi:MAG: signal recognition particle-docking protein FtsY [Actinomycetota bacterium]|jgi:fused signal recognition particle receptor
MFKFLKRWRGEKETTPEVATPEETPELVLEDAQVQEVVATPEPVVEVTPEVVQPEPVQERAPEPEAKKPEPVVEVEEVKPALAEVELPARSLGSGIRSLFGGSVDIEDLEDILIRADFGVYAAMEITEELRKEANRTGANTDAQLRLLLKDLLTARLTRPDSALNLSSGDLPYVILVVGVNGAGKTTTIGKLSRWLKDGDWSVVLGAADTFRAAAVDQLATWAQRAEAKLVRPEREGQDPAAVAYQTVELALAEQADIAIVDTAGRLQNKKDLMDELGKVRRAVEKQARISEVLLVIDATTGQNAIAQAKAFTDVANVTGIVMTKLDGSAKGGVLYALQRELDIPVKLVGVGEGVNDFAFFSAEEFAKSLVAKPNL